MDVLGKTRLGDVGLPGLDGLHQGVVDEHVLLLGLHQAVTLLPDTDNIYAYNVPVKYILL